MPASTPSRRTSPVIDVDELRYKYDQAFDTWIRRSKDLFVLFDRTFRVTYANPAFCRTFGVSQYSAKGSDVNSLGLQREMAEAWRGLLGKAVAEREEQSEERWLPTQDGLRCFCMRVVPELRMADGAVESLWVSGRDVTEIQGTQRVLGETEARFRAIVSNVPGLVFQLSLGDLDQSPEFHYVSDGAIALCGMTPERMVRKAADFIGLIHDDDLEQFFQSMRLSMETLVNWAWEGRLCGAFGDRWVSLQATPRRKDTGSVSWDGIILDVTDSKRNAEKLRQSEAFLRDLCVRVAMVREEEKRAIACEIHDELGQLLTALKLDLSWLQDGEHLGPFALSKVKRMGSLADDILHRVRDIASTLRPKVLDLGLAPAIEWLAQEFTCRTGTVCRLVLDGLDLCGNLDGARTTAIFRIVQESLTNCARHAKARSVDISFVAQAGSLRLTIRDDGVGFDPAAVEVCRIGLSGIRERAVILGADLRIDSCAKGGTMVEVLIPSTSLRPEPRAKSRSSGRRKGL